MKAFNNDRTMTYSRPLTRGKRDAILKCLQVFFSTN